MASIRGDKLTIKLRQNSSGTVNKVIAATTSCNVDISAEALETTSQDDGLNSTFMGGKLSGTISGDYLTASDGEQYTNLYTHAGAGDTIEWEVYRDGTLFMNGTGVISSISQTGGNSDTLTTGAYSMDVEAAEELGEYGEELNTQSNAAADPGGTEADATTGWGDNWIDGYGANVFESQASVKHTGSFALHADANDTPHNAAGIYIDLEAAPFSFTNGEEGKIELYARHIGSGASWVVCLAVANNETTNLYYTIPNSQTSFLLYSIEWTHDANHRYLTIRESGSDDGGVYVDNASIKKKL